MKEHKQHCISSFYDSINYDTGECEPLECVI